MILSGRITPIGLALVPLLFASARQTPTYNSFALPHPLGQMTQNNSDVFRDYVQAMDWKDARDWKLVKRKCNHNALCSGIGTAMSGVKIRAVGEVAAFDPDNSGGKYQYGVVVGKMKVDRNNGAHDEALYSLPNSGETAYLVVDASAKNWQLVLDHGSSYETIKTGTFVQCHDGPNSSQSYAGFVQACGNKTLHARVHAAIAARDSIRALVQTNRATEDALKAAEAAIAKVLDGSDYSDPTGPAWFSCIDGCCIANISSNT